MEILENVVEEHAEEAAFAWQQRDYAVRAPDFDLSDLIEWDDNVDANLDGLRIAGERGWEITREVGWEFGGEYFTAMSLAIMHTNSDWVEQILDAAEEDQQAVRGVISALGWTSAGNLQGLVKKLLADPNPYRRQVGIGACAVHRVNPGEALVDALQSDHDGLRARAFKACGEMGLVDLLPQLEARLEDQHDEARFWAAWSASLLGSPHSMQVLSLFATHDNPRKRQAMNLFIRLMEPGQAQEWLRNLARDRDQLRWALIGSGIQGDPSYLPPLMRQFENEEVARVAGESFQLITGLDIFYESLEVIPDAPEPPPVISHDNDDDEDDDDDDVSEEDYGLVVPDPVKMNPWFESNKDKFQAGQRYLCGAPVSPDHCKALLATAQQRQRQAAALELAILVRGSKLFETRAPGLRQLRRLRKLGLAV
jgi:uncharacterized protein (TIGR02270 family)